MESFVLLKENLRFIGVLRIGSDRNGQIRSIIMNWLFYSVIIEHALALSAFFVFEAKTFREYAASFYYVCYTLQVLSWYAFLFLNRNKYAGFFSELDEIVAQRSKNPISRIIYQNTNENVEILSRKIHNFLMILLYLFIVPADLMAIYDILSGRSADNYKQIIPAAFPFDWRTPKGYAACMILQSIFVYVLVRTYMCSIGTTIGHCVYTAEFITDIEASLRELNGEFIETNYTQMSYRKQFELRTKFIEIIRFYSKAREFTNRLVALDRGIVFTYLLYAMVSYCSTFLQINALLVTGDLSVIFQELVPPAVLCLTTLYIFCHYGDHFKEKFADLSHAICQTNWYNFPLDMQMDSMFMIGAAQNEVLLNGYAGTSCTRDVFKSVINTTFSYFTVLRKFES